MCSGRRKNHGCGQQKPEGTSSAIFGVGTAAKVCELKRCADQVRNRTENKDEVLEGKLVTWTFRLLPKGQLSIFLNFFIHWIKLLLTFYLLSLLKRGSPCNFASKTRDTAQVYLKCMPPHIGWPCGADGRTDGHVTNTSLPKFLGLIGYQFCLARVLRYYV